MDRKNSETLYNDEGLLDDFLEEFANKKRESDSEDDESDVESDVESGVESDSENEVKEETQEIEPEEDVIEIDPEEEVIEIEPEEEVRVRQPKFRVPLTYSQKKSWETNLEMFELYCHSKKINGSYVFKRLTKANRVRKIFDGFTKIPEDERPPRTEDNYCIDKIYNNFTLIYTDNEKYKDECVELIYSSLKENPKENYVLMSSNPSKIFQRLFLQVKDYKFSFRECSNFFQFMQRAKKIHILMKEEMSLYLFLKTVNLLNIDKSKIFINDGNLETLYKENMWEIVNEINCDPDILLKFVSGNFVRNNIRDRILFNVFKTITFDTTLFNEAFDGLMKFVILYIKNNPELEYIDANSILPDLQKEFPFVPKAVIIYNYKNFIKNFRQDRDIKLFNYSSLDLKPSTKVKINRESFNKLLDLCFIVKKNDYTFISCLLPIKLFGGENIFAFRLVDTIKNINKRMKIIVEDDFKLTRYLNDEKKISRDTPKYVKLVQHESGNRITQIDPRRTFSEFLVMLDERKLKYTIENEDIIFERPKHINALVSFLYDKNNTGHDLSDIKRLDRLNKQSVYQSMLDYLNKYFEFQLRILRYFLRVKIIKNSSETQSQPILKIFEKKFSALKYDFIGEHCYPTFNELEVDFETTLLDQIDVNTIDINEIEVTLKNLILAKLKKYIE